MGCFNSKKFDDDGNIQLKDSIFTYREHKGNMDFKTNLISCILYWVVWYVTGYSYEFNEETMKGVRSTFDTLNKKGAEGKQKKLVELKIDGKCKIDKIEIAVEEKVFVKVITYRPEGLPESGNPALIFAHGGWCLINDAEGSSH